MTAPKLSNGVRAALYLRVSTAGRPSMTFPFRTRSGRAKPIASNAATSSLRLMLNRVQPPPTTSAPNSSA